MSVLAQMASANNENTEEYLKRMYEVRRKIITSGKLEQDILKAKKLQSFLLLIKRAQKNPNLSSDEFSNFWNQTEQKVLLDKLKQMHPETFSTGAFIEYEGLNNTELGQQLERGVARIVKSFESIRTGATYKRKTKMHKKGDIKYSKNYQSQIGAKSTQIPDLIGDADEEARIRLSYTYKHTMDAMIESGHKKEYRTPEQQGTFSLMKHVSGKIDNIGLTGTIRASVSLSEIEKDIINCLQDATFTDKNYASKSDISFGQTNLFRVFMTLGGTYNRYYRMLNCFKGHTINNKHGLGPTYLRMLRIIYEITGSGMQYIDSKLKGFGMAKFLIWNNPTETGINSLKVIPTELIVQEILKVDDELKESQDWKKDAYAKIIISQSRLNKIWNNM